MKTTPVSTNRIHLSLGRSAFFLIPLLLACFALAPSARAVCQEGCDTNSNTFLGEDALINNAEGFLNTAVGWHALFSNTAGNFNTATGVVALEFNTTGSDNTATGYTALRFNTTGSANTAKGWQALWVNTTGGSNTATGFSALQNNSSGFGNTATGISALFSNTTGNNNTAIGDAALLRTRTGSNNIAMGSDAGEKLVTGSNNIYIGNAGADESSGIRIGTTGIHTKTFIAGISGATVPTGVAVIVDGSGHLGTTTSSARFKEEIKPMDKASDAILALKPVTFHYKQEIDPEGIPQFGLVAEEVEKVNPDLVARDEQGKPYTVRYEAVNAMLLNEFLKEHRTVENQQRKVELLEKAVAEQQNENAAMRAMLSEQAAQIQKVSAQLEASKPLLQTIANNQ
jgi:Chaperone of endosialidase